MIPDFPAPVTYTWPFDEAITSTAREKLPLRLDRTDCSPSISMSSTRRISSKISTAMIVASSVRAMEITRAMMREDCAFGAQRSEEHTSELQSRSDLVCRLLLE